MSIDAAVTFVLGELTELINKNYKQIKNLDGDEKVLDTELKYLRSLVQDSEEQDHSSHYKETLIEEVKAIIRLSRDVDDSFTQDLTKPKYSFSRITGRWKKAGKVKDIIAKIQVIRDRVPIALQTEESTGSTSTRHADKEVLVEAYNVVGFEEAIEEVEKIIHEGGNKLEIATIVGMLGLGKTTLANKVFMNPQNADKFIIRAFVYVSRKPVIKDVFLQILESFTQVSDEVRGMRLQQLQTHVRDLLENHRYLIVLDDVWDTDDWDRIKNVFPENNVRCRVLITTRNDAVAELADGDPYKLYYLSNDKSIELLRLRVFGDGAPPPAEFIELEATIVLNCGGLPLSIVVTAGILRDHRKDVEFWKRVATHGKYIDGEEEKVRQMTNVIEFMYKHLPEHLKECFLYLGVFQDSKIPVWKLTRLWIAEEMVKPSESMELEDWAEACLGQLISRNLVIVEKKRSNDAKIKSVRIHDTLRDFCKSKAREDCVFHEITSGLQVYKLQSDSACRRLLVNSGADTKSYISKAPRSLVHVRSFLSFSKDKIDTETKTIANLPKAFKALKVLEIQPLLFTPVFPSRISELAGLKYLCLSLSTKEIPSSFSSLVNMQTLIVHTTSPSLQINADIWKMTHFRHLHADVPTILPRPKRTDVNAEVQTLSTVSPKSCTNEVFQQVPNIRKLGIRGNLVELTALSSLRDFKSLQNMKLHNDQSFQFTSLPSDENLPKNLTKMTLIKTRLAWGEMSKLGKLKALIVLKLKDHAFEGSVWKTTDGDFPSLEHLHIGHTNLAIWEVASPHHFPQLKMLILDNCEKLQTLPAPLKDIESLRSVSLRYTNSPLVTSGKNLFPTSPKPVDLKVLR